MEKVRRKCGFSNRINLDSYGSSGGLSLGLNSDCKITLRSFSRRHIDVMIEEDLDGQTWRCTGFYGAPVEIMREVSWDFLRTLNDFPKIPWIVLGDFNKIVYSTEKKGGLPRRERQMGHFREVMEDCALTDIGYNHCPLLLNATIENQRPKQWHFRFEASWLMEESCEREVNRIWAESSGDVPSKVRAMGVGFEGWFRRIRKQKFITKKKLEWQLSKLNEAIPTDDILGAIVETKLALNMEADREELYWEQRARANWLKNKDRNTKFFHQMATDRCRRNRVGELLDGESNSYESNAELLELATNYFNSLFLSKGVGDPSSILDWVEPCISQQMNENLEKVFTYEEVCSTLKDMSPLKASEEDGLGAIFYQRFWHIVGRDVADFCIEMLQGRHDMAVINGTRIVLIPKVSSPRYMTHFRPISLCNILYKIISKMLADRFQKILHVCINEVQSAFLPGRLITDNIIVVYEILHSMKKRRVGPKGSFALKLDMSKAYDRVEWCFVQVMLKMMGFSDRWVENVMRCVTSVSYSVVMNREVGNLFIPRRGLRQGNPISPYLFLICGERLSTLLRMTASRGALSGFRVNKGGGMWFRDLSKFNIALLAKHGWCIMENPSSLISCVLRDKYFNGSNFMEAPLGTNPSLIWKSIWCAKGFLGLGLKLRIGSGTEVSIWHDYWLPGNDQRLISTEKVVGLNWVSDLILLNPNRWNSDIIYSNFAKEEVDKIVSIPIPTTRQSDKVVWFNDKSGTYSVKSGYKMLLNQSNVNVNEKTQFKQIWSLTCPSKFYESSIHAVRDCMTLTQVWSKLNIQWPSSMDNSNFKEWLSWLFENSNSNRNEEIAIAIWALWFSRNRYVHENKLQSAEELVTFIKGFALEHRDCALILKYPKPRSMVVWMPSPQGWVKINVDARISAANNRAVSGFIIRNEEGFVMGSGFKGHNLFIAQEGNKAAHAIAAEGLRAKEDLLWVEDAPSKAMEAVDSDRRFS
ncbi:hypothetical protein PVK06_047081 [Gossypium arboreum]|uniref:Reverse transcriptase domain-containing protein n=1 Tax=Gossypium arboreum TaxID=29729 RepID=A0ABR0MCP6_GOSAR|nr:hypothetical protein PVK06_047081 [Gossypium arboreum]